MKISVIIPVYNVEEYLREALESVQNQTLTDYEVLIVNDGSPDRSQEIIDEFCRKDKRFISFWKQNSGVSETRNYALDRAQGEYIFFLDGDDVLPVKALETLYRKIKETHADLSIGGISEFGVHGRKVFKTLQEITEKEDIDKYDPQLLYMFSACNKLFRRSLIEQHHLRFENLKNAEDGLFCFRYIFQCSRIVKCDAVVYKYRRRPFWKEKSATSTATTEYLKDLLSSMERIIQAVAQERERALAEAQKKDNTELLYYEEVRNKLDRFQSELYLKAVNVHFLDGFYRQIWKSDDGMYALLKESVEAYKRHMFPEAWDRLLKKQGFDLKLENGILTKEELIREPLVTVAISDRVPTDCLNTVLDSVYTQRMPSFVVFVHAKHKNAVDGFYREKINLTVMEEETGTAAFKEAVLRQAKSPYISFIDEPIYINLNTYRHFAKWLWKNPALDFATCRVKMIRESGQPQECEAHDICFFEPYLQGKKTTRYHEIDWMSGNKLFCVRSLKYHKIKFTDDPAADMRALYKKLRFNALETFYVLTPMTEKEILSRVQNRMTKLTWRRQYRRLMARTEQGRKEKAAKKQKKIWAWKRFLISLMPLQKKVLFVSVRGNRLLENSKAVYEAYDGKKYVWSHMSPHSSKQKLQLYWHLFTSKVIVTDDYFRYFQSFRLKPQQKIIQIWHACGAFKKFGLDNPAADIQKERKYHDQYDTVCVSSETVTDIYAKAFGVDPKKVKALGVPRTDKLLDAAYLKEERESFFKKYPKLAGKTIILYAPTFREDGTRRIIYDPRLDWAHISRELGEESVLIVKNHPVMKYDLLAGRTYPNICNMPKEDTSRLLIVCDVLVTDYSSVIFEAALLEKPIVFYCPDFESYERDFYLDFPNDIYGELTTAPEAFLDALRRALTEPDMSGLKKFREQYLGSCDGKSAERVAALIAQKLKEA